MKKHLHVTWLASLAALIVVVVVNRESEILLGSALFIYLATTVYVLIQKKQSPLWAIFPLSALYLDNKKEIKDNANTNTAD